MINQRMYALGSRRSVIREIFEYCKTRAAQIGAENVFDFSIGNPSVAPPPEVTQTAMHLLQEYDSVSLHGYTSAQGDAGVRGAIAEDIRRRYGVDITADHIYMTCGAAASLTISLKALMDAGDECILFAPFFTEYRVFVENAGGVPVVSMPDPDTLAIDPADLENRITEKTKAVIINSPNNPSGVVYGEDLIRSVAQILKRRSEAYGHPIYLICDEPYRELVFDGRPVPYLMNYYDNTLVCYSYSKALSLPGERIGYIAVCPKAQDQRDVYLAVCGAGRSMGYVCAPSLFQHIIGKTVGAKVDVGIYKANRDLLYNALTSFGYDCVHPDGAFYLFVKTPEPDAYAFFEKAKERELLVVPCDDFGIKGYVRIAYCVDKGRIERALPAFSALAESYGLPRRGYTLIATDLDGTLLSDDKTVSAANSDAIDRLKARGVRVVPCTGRAPEELPSMIKDDPRFSYIICSDGATIVDVAAADTRHTPMPAELTGQVYDIIRSYKTISIVHKDGKGFVNAATCDRDLCRSVYHMSDLFCDIVCDVSQPVEDFDTFCLTSEMEMFCTFFADDAEREACRARLSALDVHVMPAAPYNFEVVYKEAGKGNALRRLCHSIGTDIAKTIGVGDTMNDATLVQAAGLGLVPENGMEEVKTLADCVICSNEDSILPYIEKSFL